MTLVPGRRYLCSCPPWGVMTVTYLGEAPIPRWSRVQNPLTRKRCWVKTESLRPYLVECGRDRAVGS